MMARTELMSLASRSCCSGPMMGMPPPTLASYRSRAPDSPAAACSAGPCFDTTSLLAVTTLTPFESSFVR